MLPLILVPATGAGLLILLIYGGAFGWRVMRRRKNVRLFEGLQQKYQFEFVGAHDFFLDDSPPYLKGKLSGCTVHVMTQPQGRGRYLTIIRVESALDNSLRYTVKRSTVLRTVAAAVSDKDITTGHAQFDSLFILSCNNEEFALKLFDQFVCEDFAANAGTFEFTSLVFQHGYLEFREQQLLSSNSRMARIDEIMQFMAHLVEKGDAIRKPPGK